MSNGDSMGFVTCTNNGEVLVFLCEFCRAVDVLLDDSFLRKRARAQVGALAAGHGSSSPEARSAEACGLLRGTIECDLHVGKWDCLYTG